MDVTIVAALVGAIGAILGSVLGVAIGRRALRRTIEVRERFYSAAKAFDPVYTFDTIEVLLQFDESGNGIWHKRYVGLRSRLKITDFSFPYRVVSAEGPGVSTPLVSALPGSNVPVRFEVAEDSNSRTQGRIVLEGMLRPGEVIPGFAVEQRFQNAFHTTRRSALAAYKDRSWKTEYASFIVTAPANSLSIDVEFPPSHEKLSPPPSPIVFTGNSELINQDERQRISRCLTFADKKAHLLVDKPKVGLMYGISWLPPDK